jgi:hypothetical protein
MPRAAHVVVLVLLRGIQHPEGRAGVVAHLIIPPVRIFIATVLVGRSVESMAELFPPLAQKLRFEGVNETRLVRTGRPVWLSLSPVAHRALSGSHLASMPRQEKM